MALKKGTWVGLGITGAALAAWYIYNQYKLTEKLCFKAVDYRINKLAFQATNIQIDLQNEILGN